MKYVMMSLLVCGSVMFAGCKSENTQNAEATEDMVEETQTEQVAEPVVPQRQAWMPDSVQVTPTGLGIVIHNPGDSVRATPSDNVTVHYRGVLTDGTQFDSSYDRGVPATFPVGGVVPGFAEGLQMVGQGGTATLYIPGNLAYGPRGVPQAGIGPNEPLIFDIEIIEIHK